MTWRELFRRAWLVLRLRRKTFLLCMDCRVPLIATSERTEYNRCHECYELDCLALRKEMKRRAKRGDWDHDIYLRQLAMQNTRPGAIDPLSLQTLIGAPIRVPAPGMISFLGSAIGSAIGGVIGHNPLE
jgi:hypothetical protein